MADKISVIEFLGETKDDISSPTTSTFTSKMSLCRATIAALEESLDADRSALKKMRNSMKAMYNSGQDHVDNETVFIDNLEKLGGGALYGSQEPESDTGSAFLKLAVFTKELASLLKNLISSLNNILVFPLESLLKGDLKGIKGDMKRPFDKSWKDYDTKLKQVEREKRHLAKEAGMIRSEITGAEVAEEMEKERRMFQLQMCEYLIKANEVKTKRGVDLLQHLVEYYHMQSMFFNDGCKIIEHFRAYAEDLTANLRSQRQSQDEERRQLIELKNLLKISVNDSENAALKPPTHVYNLHQLQGNKALGNEKSGYLMKRSEGLRRAWQRRRCFVTDGFLTISHSKTNKPPVKLNLLTSQLKLVPEDKKQFDLVSHNRTYRFMAEDDNDAVNWISVITNSKEDALNRVFGHASGGSDGSEQIAGLRELTNSIIKEIQRLPGNTTCCDCSATEPTWLSTNLGVLLCIECSGIHRDMGVHISRIQSITLDDLGTSELLLARSVGNCTFNSIMEETLDVSLKPSSTSDMEERKTFIRGKYISRNYVVPSCGNDSGAIAEELSQAIQSCDIVSLLQLYAENADLSTPISGSKSGETALHLAASMTTNDCLGSVLPLVDFLCQNMGSGINITTHNSGNTALHICAEANNSECMKLLLKSKAKTDIENFYGETPADIASRRNNVVCNELLEKAALGKFLSIAHIDIDWNLTLMDDDDFNSDDDLEDRSMSLYPASTQGVIQQLPENICRQPSSLKDKSKPNFEKSVPLPPPRQLPPAIPPHGLSRKHGQLGNTGTSLSSLSHQDEENKFLTEKLVSVDPISIHANDTRMVNSLLDASASLSSSRPKRVLAKYDCEADNQDELTFVENEVIVVTGVEDQE
ncbi:arf-GAP with SH3 domain, ANK repeat and PH domain-containing protein 1-like isoform X2 [Clavelina lepadiformis]